MTTPEPARVVFDCMIFLQATTRATGPAAACLRLLDLGSITLFVCDDILREVEDVLDRPKVRQKNPLLTDLVVRRHLDRLSKTATLIDPVPTQLSVAFISNFYWQPHALHSNNAKKFVTFS